MARIATRQRTRHRRHRSSGRFSTALMRGALGVGLLVTSLGACSSKVPTTNGDGSTPPGPDGRPAPSDVGAALLPVIRSFRCDEAGLPQLFKISDVAGHPGAAIHIRKTDRACQFDLVYRDGAAEETVSSRAGGFLLAGARAAPGGDTLLCASNIEHIPDATGGVGGARITAVPLLCALRRLGRWTPLTEVVNGQGQWAAWILDLEASTTPAGALRVRWRRDSTFQFLNLTDKGRPADDGTYRVDLTLGQGGTLVAGPLVRDAQETFAGSVTQRGWDPTPAELRDYAAFIDAREGSCPAPAGCKP